MSQGGGRKCVCAFATRVDRQTGSSRPSVAPAVAALAGARALLHQAIRGGGGGGGGRRRRPAAKGRGDGAEAVEAAAGVREWDGMGWEDGIHTGTGRRYADTHPLMTKSPPTVLEAEDGGGSCCCCRGWWGGGAGCAKGEGPRLEEKEADASGWPAWWWWRRSPSCMLRLGSRPPPPAGRRVCVRKDGVND